MERPKAIAEPEQGKTFTGRVVIDERTFVNCVFSGATLVYFGGTPPGFQGCRFESVSWDFKSSARNTIGLMQAFSRHESGFRALFDEIFPLASGEDAAAANRNVRNG